MFPNRDDDDDPRWGRFAMLTIVVALAIMIGLFEFLKYAAVHWLH